MTDFEHNPDADPHQRADPHHDAGIDRRGQLAEATAIHEAPPVSEEIHMPDPSLIPIINAVGVTTALIGLTTSTVVLIAGLLIVLVTTVLWVRDTRHEIASLPAGHDHH